MPAVFVAMLLAMPAAEVESREYRILVDGKPAGSYRMTISKQQDGSIVQAGQADVMVQVLLKKFVYSCRGQETWKNGKLIKLEASTNDDGKRYQVRVEPIGSELRVTVNGKTHMAPSAASSTSHWHLPADRRQGDITRIDTDNGRVLAGKIFHVGRENVMASGQSMATDHYRITGTAPAELWFDGTDRLVRQETVEEGHKVVLELVKFTR